MPYEGKLHNRDEKAHLQQFIAKPDVKPTTARDKQLKTALADTKFVAVYEDALSKARKAKFAVISMYLYGISHELWTGSWHTYNLAIELALFGLQTLFADRNNPNEADDKGLSPLHYIIKDFDVRFTTLALAYRANPFLTQKAGEHPGILPHLPKGFPPSPPIASASLSLKDSELYGHYGVIERLASRPQHTPSSMMRIYGYTIKTKNGRKFIHFDTNKGSFTNQILSTKNLTPKELEFIYNHYRKYFKASPTLKGTLDKFFAHEMQGPCKLVELIFAGDKFIGMHLHKIFEDPRYPNCVSHYISCAYMDNAFRGLGLSDPLMMSLPSLMPKLFKDKVVIGSLQAIFVGAAKLLKGLECFPQYRDRVGFFSQYAKDNFKHMQEVSDSDPNPTLVNDTPGQCSSALPVQPVAESKELSLDVVRFNLQRGIQIYEIGRDPHLGVLYVFTVDDEFIEKYFGSCAKLKLHGGKFLNDLAPHIAELIPELNPKFIKDAVPVPKHSMIFEGFIVLSQTIIPPFVNRAHECRL